MRPRGIANSPTKIEWSKIDRETGQILGGSSWNLQQQVNSEWKTLNVVTDCSQAPCKAEPEDVQYYDADPKPGAFRVERLPVGTYGIVEQPMEGYHPHGHRYTFTVDGTLIIGGVALASGAKQVLDNAIGNWRLCCLMWRCVVEGGDVRGGAVAYWPSCHNRRPNSRCVARWFRYEVVPSLLRVVLSWVRRLLHKKGKRQFSAVWRSPAVLNDHAHGLRPAHDLEYHRTEPSAHNDVFRRPHLNIVNTPNGVMDTIADGQFPRVERTAVVVRAFCTPRTRQRPLCPRSSPECLLRRASFRDSVGPFEVGVEPDGGPKGGT